MTLRTLLIIALFPAILFGAVYLENCTIINSTIKEKGWALDADQTASNSAVTSAPTTNSTRFKWVQDENASRIKVIFYGFAFVPADLMRSCPVSIKDIDGAVLISSTAWAHSSMYTNEITLSNSFTQGSTYYVELSSPSEAMCFNLTNSGASSTDGAIEHLSGSWTADNKWATFYVYRWE